MKQKPDNVIEYNKQLDELAKEAMKCILNGAYYHPVTLAQLGEIAAQNKVSMVLEIAERSYTMATIMMKHRRKFLMKDEGNSTDTK